MRLDVAKIDDRIRKLQQLRKLAEDEDFVDLFNQVLSNGNGNARPAPLVKPRSNGHAGVGKKGSFTKEVEKVCGEFKANFFVARDVLNKLHEREFPIEAKNKYTAVLGILKKMVDRKQLTVTEAEGRKPYVYSNPK